MGNDKPESREYWMIPGDDMGLPEFLKAAGYKVPSSNSTSDKGPFDILKSGRTLGQMHRPESSDYQVFIKYEVENGLQIGQALKLRRLLDVNNIRYQEIPAREKVSKKLRELGSEAEEQGNVAQREGLRTRKNLNTLAERIDLK
ncbi:hypothetical protein HOD75_01370 [archaeon]|jgi:hypothetical protein|nr:hypothetical protein [archaeon]MBT4241528.1 hypothetical protein [archaeon]MBT4417601.1 hypothetical protein [archaeon]